VSKNLVWFEIGVEKQMLREEFGESASISVFILRPVLKISMIFASFRHRCRRFVRL
jgi:hypothetical protein